MVFLNLCVKYKVDGIAITFGWWFHYPSHCEAMLGFTLGLIKVAALEKSYCSWARGDHPRASRLSWSTCTGRVYEGKSVLKEKLLFFCLRITLGIWTSISANVFLCSAPRPTGTMFPRLVTLPHPVSSWPWERSQWTDSSASSCAPGWASLSKAWPEQPRETAALTLPSTLGTCYLCSHGRETAITTNADEERGPKTSRKKPFTQILPSAPHQPSYKQLHWTASTQKWQEFENGGRAHVVAAMK